MAIFRRMSALSLKADEYDGLVRPPTTLACHLGAAGSPRRGLFAVAPLNSAHSQAQSHRRLERRRYVGGELRIDLTAAMSFSWARSEALQFVPLEVVETIAGSGRGRVDCLFSPSASFFASMGFQRVDVSAAPLPQSFLALFSKCR
jgi:hypothetical protein